MLVLKLLLTPLFVGLIGLADRRWGARVGGWLVGLPLTSAPVTAFVAFELGRAFAGHMAMAILLGLISQALFCLIYAWLSFRLNWFFCWLCGWGVFGLSTLALEQITLPLSLAFLCVVGMLVLVLALWPPAPDQTSDPMKAPAWAMPVRMLLATGCVLALTTAASVLGPRLSGLLSPLPVFATVFALVAHKLRGSGPARQILRGVVLSSFACAVFFLVVADWIERWNGLMTFGGATCLALFTQGLLLWLQERRISPGRCGPARSRPIGSAEKGKFWPL
ncbi:hypothetical protein [Thermogemmatispora sp.]|uniref:hypothetical protein n=1 Tax=Thermogemmatispora sp. TaxID=1968838 RepID=UPI0035E404E3